jgi:hypothetical protein
MLSMIHDVDELPVLALAPVADVELLGDGRRAAEGEGVGRRRLERPGRGNLLDDVGDGRPGS